MEISHRELFGLIHGIFLGSVYLLSFGATLIWLRSYRQDFLSEKGRIIRAKRMKPTVWTLAVVCWLTVITGTFITYPWYRAVPPEGADLTLYPQAYLASHPEASGWHSFGMEWKEHIAWLPPFIFTSIAYVASMYGEVIAKNDYIRRSLMWLLILAFVATGVAALLGALITKKAPIL